MLNFSMAVAALKAINPITAATSAASVAAVVGGVLMVRKGLKRGLPRPTKANSAKYAWMFASAEREVMKEAVSEGLDPIRDAIETRIKETPHSMLGIPVIVWDDLCMLKTHIPREYSLSACILVDYKCILVSRDFMSLKPAIRNAILAHEAGHVILEHGNNAGEIEEMEADRFAISNGFDMRAALEHLRQDAAAMNRKYGTRFNIAYLNYRIENLAA